MITHHGPVGAGEVLAAGPGGLAAVARAAVAELTGEVDRHAVVGADGGAVEGDGQRNGGGAARVGGGSDLVVELAGDGAGVSNAVGAEIDLDLVPAEVLVDIDGDEEVSLVVADLGLRGMCQGLILSLSDTGGNVQCRRGTSYQRRESM